MVAHPEDPLRSPAHNAAYWRLRAAEARAEAAKLGSSKAQMVLLNIVKTYDYLARLAERARSQGA